MRTPAPPLYKAVKHCYLTLLYVTCVLQEALELGASVLLMDEDTCATNFMMRDARMAALVAPAKEPITPFSSRIACVAAAAAASEHEPECGSSCLQLLACVPSA